MSLSRRGLLGARLGLIAAPAIIRVAELMPIKAAKPNALLMINEITREALRTYYQSYLNQLTSHDDQYLRIWLPNNYVATSR